MSSATVPSEEKSVEHREHEETPAAPKDPRLLLVERIIGTEPFQKSTRLPSLLLYLAKHTISGDRYKLSEQAIGQAVFGKRSHYSPAEDSVVRVYVRQLRLKLHEYYQSSNVHEDLIVSIPKGGYALEFTPTRVAELPVTVAETTVNSKSGRGQVAVLWALLTVSLAAACVCGVGWYKASAGQQAAVPWPLSRVIHKGSPTTVVMADAGFALRMLGDKEVSLDSYIDHDYLQPILPKHLSENESIVLHYFDSSRITSDADAQAVGMISSLAGPYADNLRIRSARDVNANDLTHGDFIFLGSKTSNPWVQLLDARMNFQIIEDDPHAMRYVLNRNPRNGEQAIYRSDSMGTLSSGDDYAVIALLPAKTGAGAALVVEGVRMEGTNAAIALLRSPAGRARLESKLASLNEGHAPQFFEALLRAQSVAGATMSFDIIGARVSN